MNVAFVFPKVAKIAVTPPLGIGYLTSILLNDGFNVTFYHCGKDNLTDRALISLLRDFKPNIIGFQSFSFFHSQTEQLARQVKTEFPESLTVIGGPHASGLREAVLHPETAFDYGFAGEAEIGFRKFVQQVAGGDLRFTDLPGLIWREAETCHANDFEVVRKLDEIPMPAWEHIDIHSYPHQAHGVFPPGFPVAPIMFSRGCRYNCAYCASQSITGPGVRYRSTENIMAEIDYLVSELDIHNIAFIDQNIIAIKKKVLDLCKALIDSRLKVNWYCPNGVYLESLDEELLEQMRAAGCKALTVGIESASSENLRQLNRKMISESIDDKLALLEKHKIDVTGNFILGLPNENAWHLWQTIKYSLQLKLDRAQFAFFVPFPGTAIFLEAFGNDFESQDWDLFDVTIPVHVRQTSRFTAWFMMVLAFMLFYVRPRILMNNIREIRSLEHLKYILSRIGSILTGFFEAHKSDKKG